MNFNRRAQDRLRVAEGIEITDSEALFVGDLKDLLDDTALREGVSISFGDSPEALQSALDLLDIETLTGEDRYFNVMQGIVRSGNTKGIMSNETTSPLVKAHGILSTIELLQADGWRLTHDTFKRIMTSDESVSSWLLLNHVDYEQDGTFNLAPKSTCVMVGASVLYQPECLNDYGENGTIAYQYEEVLKVPDYRQRFARLGQMLDMNDTEIRLPQTNYILQIGQHMESDSSDTFFGFAPTGLYPSYGFYDLKNGRIVRNAYASRDNLE
jgi:hypothetical protein